VGRHPGETVGRSGAIGKGEQYRRSVHLSIGRARPMRPGAGRSEHGRARVDATRRAVHRSWSGRTSATVFQCFSWPAVSNVELCRCWRPLVHPPVPACLVSYVDSFLSLLARSNADREQEEQHHHHLHPSRQPQGPFLLSHSRSAYPARLTQPSLSLHTCRKPETVSHHHTVTVARSPC
jgi:hypothetical protein